MRDNGVVLLETRFNSKKNIVRKKEKMLNTYAGIQNAYGCANLKNSTWAYEGMKRSCTTAYPPSQAVDTSLWKTFTSDIYIPYNTMGKTYEAKNENKFLYSQH